MLPLTKVLLALAVLSVSSAAPAPTNPATKTSPGFKINLVPKKHAAVRNGPASYARALRKFGGNLDRIDTAVKAAKLGAVNASSVTATPAEFDIEYTAPVQIGNQVFQLNFDTGSSDLWVLGSALGGSVRGTNHTLYKPSSSAKALNGSTWQIQYGDGSGASGKVYSDTVTIGNTTVTAQAIEEADDASSTFLSPEAAEDGLVGLGFDSINTVTPKPVKTFFTNAVEQGLPEAVFTSLLKKGEPGAYTFGKIDESQYTGEITYTTVDSSQGFWEFSPTSYSVGESEGAGAASALTGIADTGTTLLLIDDVVVEDYYQKVQSAQFSRTDGGYVFDCNEELPDFTLVVENYQAVVPGNFINYAPTGTGTCFGGIQSSSGIPFAIYGDILLKSQFVVFDATQDTPRLGFAAQA